MRYFFLQAILDPLDYTKQFSYEYVTGIDYLLDAGNFLQAREIVNKTSIFFQSGYRGLYDIHLSVTSTLALKDPTPFLKELRLPKFEQRQIGIKNDYLDFQPFELLSFQPMTVDDIDFSQSEFQFINPKNYFLYQGNIKLSSKEEFLHLATTNYIEGIKVLIFSKLVLVNKNYHDYDVLPFFLDPSYNSIFIHHFHNEAMLVSERFIRLIYDLNLLVGSLGYKELPLAIDMQ